jgi:hypothetical protein
MKDMMTILWIFGLGVAIATVNKMFHYSLNPNDITRKPDGRVNWPWCIFTFTTAVFVGGLVSVFVGVAVVGYFDLTDIQKFAIAGASAIAGEKIWLIVKNSLEKKAESIGDSL